MKRTLHNLPIFGHLHFSDCLPVENLYPTDLTEHNLSLFRVAESILNTRMLCTFVLTLIGLWVAACVPSLGLSGLIGSIGVVIYTRFLLKQGRLFSLEAEYRKWAESFIQ